MKSQVIIEKKIGIPPDYQYQALRGKNFPKANWHSNKLYILRNFINFSKKCRVLDLGTGSGNFELEFANKVDKIVGLDYNDEALGFLEKKLKEKNISNVQLLLADIRSIGKIKHLGRFDVVIVSDVIEHIRIEDARTLVGSLSSLLKKNGIVSVITPNYKSLWVVIERFTDFFSFLPRLLGSQHLTRYHKANLNKIFETNHYVNTSFHTFNFLSYLFPPKGISAWLADKEARSSMGFGNLIFATYQKHQ